MPATTPPVRLPDRYRVTRKIASGGMATVYATEDTLLGRLVAVKVLGDHFTADADARERFQREARAAARVSDHPHVVTIYDIGEHDGLPFIVMEYFPGGTLSARLRADAPIPRPQALTWLEDAASALDHAHRHRIVHRDVKPGNLLIDDHGRLAVGDFGIARMATEAVGLTMTGQVMGTAAYISPEQALGYAATAASDRYALAVVAYELLAGRRPFHAEHAAAQARAHVEATAPPASETAADLPPAVDEVLWRGLAKDPADRWPTAYAMVAALGDALGDAAEPDRTASTRAMPIAAAPPPPPPPRTPRPRTAAPGTAPPRTPPRRTPAPAAAAAGGPHRSRSWVPWAVLAAVALLIGAGIAALSGGGGSGSGSTDRQADSARGSTAQRDRPRTAKQQSAASQQPRTQAQTQAQPPAAATQPPAAPSGDPSALQAQGHQALAAGDTEQAISLLRQAVQNCPVSQTDPCAYAYYDLGVALLQAGRTQEAAQVLQTRLQNPDQQDTVKKALKDAMRGGGKGNGGQRGGGQGQSD